MFSHRVTREHWHPLNLGFSYFGLIWSDLDYCIGGEVFQAEKSLHTPRVYSVSRAPYVCILCSGHPTSVRCVQGTPCLGHLQVCVLCPGHPMSLHCVFGTPCLYTVSGAPHVCTLCLGHLTSVLYIRGTPMSVLYVQGSPMSVRCVRGTPMSVHCVQGTPCLYAVSGATTYCREC